MTEVKDLDVKTLEYVLSILEANAERYYERVYQKLLKEHYTALENDEESPVDWGKLKHAEGACFAVHYNIVDVRKLLEAQQESNDS